MRSMLSLFVYPRVNAHFAIFEITNFSTSRKFATKSELFSEGIHKMSSSFSQNLLKCHVAKSISSCEENDGDFSGLSRALSSPLSFE